MLSLKVVSPVDISVYSWPYIWTPERCYQWSYVQDSTGDIDLKNRLELSGRRRGWVI